MLEIVEKGLRGSTIDDLVDGWSFTIDEISSNVYKVDATDVQGKHVSGYGIDPEKVLTKCIKRARRIRQRTKMIADIKSYITKKLRLK
jgi:hypothetical protein